MILTKAKRSTTSFCRVCGKRFDKGEMYVKLHGSHRVLRSKMCMDHFKVRECNMCDKRLRCLTNEKKTLCIVGGMKDTFVEEV